MTMTAEEHKARANRSYKLLLLFGMISMTMMFAGITSAFIVSTKRADWAKDFQMPSAFIISLFTIMGCSLTIHLAKKAIQQDNRSKTMGLLWATLLLGGAFVFFQFMGFQQMVAQGNYLTGPKSNITATFLYLVVIAHLAHLAGGIISLLVIIYNHFKQKYNSSQFIGIELGAMYWHFLDFLWIYLFLFLYFFK